MNCRILMNFSVFLLLILTLQCNNATSPNKQNVKLEFTFMDGFNQSPTTLTINNKVIFDSTITSELIDPHSGSAHWVASIFDTLFEAGRLNIMIKIEGVEKDTVIELINPLYNYIWFLPDSQKIFLGTQNMPIIYM